MGVLTELAATEQELEGIVTSQDGTMEELDARLRDLGIYRRYSEVFARYLEAHNLSPDDLEPLKRAAFLAWYELTEPPCFSGVGDLPADARERIVRILNERAATLDPEFQWMLAYYFDIAPDAFPGLDSHPTCAVFWSLQTRKLASATLWLPTAWLVEA